MIKQSAASRWPTWKRVARDGLAPGGIPSRSKALRRSSRPMTKKPLGLSRVLKISGKDSLIQSVPGAVDEFSKGMINSSLLARTGPLCCWAWSGASSTDMARNSSERTIPTGFLKVSKLYRRNRCNRQRQIPSTDKHWIILIKLGLRIFDSYRRLGTIASFRATPHLIPISGRSAQWKYLKQARSAGTQNKMERQELSLQEAMA